MEQEKTQRVIEINLSVTGELSSSEVKDVHDLVTEFYKTLTQKYPQLKPYDKRKT